MCVCWLRRSSGHYLFSYPRFVGVVPGYVGLRLAFTEYARMPRGHSNRASDSPAVWPRTPRNVRRSGIGSDEDGARALRSHRTISCGRSLKRWKNPQNVSIEVPDPREKSSSTMNGRSDLRNQYNLDPRGRGIKLRKKGELPSYSDCALAAIRGMLGTNESACAICSLNGDPFEVEPHSRV